LNSGAFFCFCFKVSYRDPSNNLITLKNLRLEIKDFNSLPPQNTLGKKLLNDSVSSTITNGIANNEREIDTEQYQLHIRSKKQNCFCFQKIFILNFYLDTTPWFDSWRDCFLRISYSGDHEFLKNYLACKLKYKIFNFFRIKKQKRCYGCINITS
jgi:hypothetical protein